MDDNAPAEPPIGHQHPASRRHVPSLVMVNTGHGKGKSTAAFGLLLRAIARDWRCTVVQFVKSGSWKVDEITYPINWEWIDIGEVVAAIQDRAATTTVVCTGRDAPDALIDVADTVTEMRNVKHAYQRGVRARRGIDY